MKNTNTHQFASCRAEDGFMDLDTLKCLIVLCSFGDTDLNRRMQQELIVFMSSCQGVAVKQTSMVNIQELDDDGLNTFLDEIINSKKGKERQLQLGIERAEYMAMEKAELQGLVGLIRKFDDAKEYLVDKDRKKKFRVVFQDHEPDELTGLLIGLTPNDAARAIQVFYAQGTTKECTPSEIYAALDLYLDNLPSISLIGKALREEMPETRRKARNESCRVCLKQS